MSGNKNKILSVQWNLSFETPLFKGHLHSLVTKFGLGKMFTQFLYLLRYLYWRDTSIQGKGTLFPGLKTQMKPPIIEHLSTQKETDQ